MAMYESTADIPSSIELTTPALILVDPQMNQLYNDPVDKRPHYQGPHTIEQYPFQGGSDDILQQPSEHLEESPDPCPRSMFDDLIRCWTKEQLTHFDPLRPSLASLSYYSLRLAVAESQNHADLLRYMTQTCESAIGLRHFPDRNMDYLDDFFRQLQVWRSRSICDSRTLGQISSFLKQLHQEGGADHDTKSKEALQTVIDLYQGVMDQTNHYWHRLETLAPMATSLVQILDSRRSFEEACSLSRLTYLALIFIPLSYISSLFSMEGRFAPGQSGFGWYFVAALPVLALVFLIARPPAVVLRAKNKALESVAYYRYRRARDKKQIC